MTRSRRLRALPVLTAVAALTLALAGCASGAPATPTTPVASPSPSATDATDPSRPADPNAPSGQCADDALEITISGGDAGAGNIGYDLVFTNTGADACELRGAPGVSVVDATGAQLGQPADQIGDDDPQTQTLAPGGSAVAQLTAVNIDPNGGPLDNCPVVHGTGYRVYPPHSFTGFIVDSADVPACDSPTVFLSVGAVQAG
jgi:phage tail sheath protein FI